MIDVRGMVNTAKDRGHGALSEYESKQVLAAYGIPVTREFTARNWKETREAATRIGFPVVLKVCSPNIAHKTEKGLIAVDLRDEAGLKAEFERMKEHAAEDDAFFLVQEMVKGERELVMGMVRDPQFGPCVMFGLGGIFTETLNDVVFRVAPLEKRDAYEMMDEIRGSKLLGAVRGMEPVDREAIAAALTALGSIGLEQENIREIDVNPLIVSRGRAIAVDGLVVLK